MSQRFLSPTLTDFAEYPGSQISFVIYLLRRAVWMEQFDRRDPLSGALTVPIMCCKSGYLHLQVRECSRSQESSSPTSSCQDFEECYVRVFCWHDNIILTNKWLSSLSVYTHRGCYIHSWFSSISHEVLTWAAVQSGIAVRQHHQAPSLSYYHRSFFELSIGLAVYHRMQLPPSPSQTVHYHRTATILEVDPDATIS